MSPRSRRRTPRPSTRRASARRGAAQSVPRQRRAPETEDQQRARPFTSNDDALLVLHRAVEDPAFQQFLDEMPLVQLIARFLEWVEECEELEDETFERRALLDAERDDAEPDDAEHDPTERDGGQCNGAECDGEHLTDVDGRPDAASEAALFARLGVEVIGSTAVERWRARVLSMACTRWGLVSLTEEGLEACPDVLGWNSPDSQSRAWVRSLVVASAVECTVRYVAAQHLEGDQVRFALATMLASAGEDSPWPLGLMSALRPDDLLSEHVDRVVLEHVTELRAWGVLAEGDHLRVAPGAEPLLQSIAVGLRADPVSVPTSAP